MALINLTFGKSLFTSALYGLQNSIKLRNKRETSLIWTYKVGLFIRSLRIEGKLLTYTQDTARCVPLNIHDHKALCSQTLIYIDDVYFCYAISFNK